MRDAPEAPPGTVSAGTRLIGLAVLATAALVALAVWTRLSGKPDTARLEAARRAAQPHLAGLERCLLGAPLAIGETASERLRGIVLAEETRGRTAGWPGRCVAHVRAARAVLEPLRREDSRIDRLVATLFSAQLAIARGRPPKGVDVLVTAIARAGMNGGSAPAGVAAAPTPLRLVRAVDASDAILGGRRDRFLGREAGALWFAGDALRACRPEGPRVVCGAARPLAPTRSAQPVPTVGAGGDAGVEALALERGGDAPARLRWAQGASDITLGDDVYGVLAQRGGALVLRAGPRRPRSTLPGSVLVESVVGADAPRALGALAVPGSLLRSPQLVAGFAYVLHADLRARRPGEGPASPGFGIEVAWLPEEADAPLPPPRSLRIDALPAQVLGCVGATGRAFALLTDARAPAPAPRERAVAVRFYGAAGEARGEAAGALAGTAAVADCVGDDLALVARAQEVVDGRRVARFTGLRCGAGGCAVAAAVVPTSDVPEVVTLRDGRVLIVYRAGAAGGLRARVGALSALGAAPEIVLADDTAHGGLESAERWLHRDGDGALLVLATRLGHVAVHLGPDARPTLLRP